MELSGYLAVARRWWWTLLVATWVAGVSGYVVASQIPPTYEAETQLLVGPYNTDRDTLAAAGDLVQTYSQLVTTTPLLESAISESGANITPADLALATRVTANDTTRFLSIRVQNTDPKMAATLANKLADEITQLASRGTSRPEGQIQPVQFAVPPTDPIAPQKSLIVGLAALAALIGAMVLVMLVEYLSAAVRSEDELTRLTGMPHLGNVDISRSLPSAERGLLDKAPESAAAAAYRLVQAKAAFLERGRAARSIVVVGAGSDSASSQVAANLAGITARSGRQVVLIDNDGSDGSVTRIYKLGDRSGVTDLIDASPADVSSRLVRVSPNLRVLPYSLSDEGDTIDAERASVILKALAESADLVMINGGVLHLSAGALAWAQAADTSILVAVRDQARRDDVEYAAESLRLVGVEAGTVLAERKRGLGRGRQRTSDRDRARAAAATQPPVEPLRPIRDTPRPTYPEPEPIRDYRTAPEPMSSYRPTPAPEPVRDYSPAPAPEPVRDYSPQPEPMPQYRPEVVPDPYSSASTSDMDMDPEPEPEEAPPPPPVRTTTRRSPRRRTDPQPNT
ncbi:MAG TPA: Wzz/FepE/Etk N-terminal domain-containing protein [Candidatus Limnocylindrales bacterium]|nr:Wzz/FepE/Etk N-terminal domain-containing protein [Candidatus Limnocylindrales bacterium]